MRKLVLNTCLIFTFLTSFSCKKIYTCGCVTTVTYSGTPPSNDIFNSGNTKYSEKMTEKQARAACDHEATTINSTIDDNIKQSNANGRAIAKTNCNLQ